MTLMFRKVASVLLVAALLIIACTVGVLAVNILGDADTDGSVTVMDATLVQRVLAGVPANCDYSEINADADSSGEIEITDATFIQRMVAGFDTPYPIGVQPTEPSTQPPTQVPTDPEGWGREIFKP